MEIEEDEEQARRWEETDETEVKIYTDGSGIDGLVGAAAVVYRNGEEVAVRRKALGKLTEHKVYDGEGVGLHWVWNG